MLFLYVVSVCTWAIIIVLGDAYIASPDLTVRDLDFPKTHGTDAVGALKRALYATRIHDKREVFTSNQTRLDRYWENATLFSLSVEGNVQQKGASSPVEGQATLEITCVKCYVKGEATAQLTINNNITVTNYKDELESDIKNISSAVVNEIKETFGDIGQFQDWDDLNLDQNLNLYVPKLSGSELHIELNGVELFMQLETKLSGQATYTLNLLTRGLGLSRQNFAGLILTIDLILSAEAAIDISSGFHIKFDDAISIDIPVFDERIAHINIGGGHFEFLPVSLESTGVVLQAILRIGTYIGLEVDVDESLVSDAVSFGAGVAAGIFADVAEFVTTVTFANGTCDMKVEESYTLAVGAEAGAFVRLLDQEWGPTPNTTTAIFYTTLGEVCVTHKQVTTTTPAAAVTTSTALERRVGDIKRRDLTTTTLSTVETYTGVGCKSPGIINCPLSLQHTTKQSVTRFLTTSVSDGESASFPPTTQDTVPQTIDFGTNAKTLFATSGSPTSFIPPKSTSGSESHSPFKADDDSARKRIIIGVTVSVGALLLLAALIWLWIKKRNSSRKLQTKQTEQTVVQDSPGLVLHWDGK